MIPSPDGLNITVSASEKTLLRLCLEGQLDTLTAPELESYIREEVGAEVKTLILDLQRLRFVSSAGLRVFAKTRRNLKAQGGALYFVQLSPQVEKVFQLVKAVPLNEVFASIDELDAYLATMQRGG